MDLDLEYLRGVFIAESEEGLANMEQALVRLEATPTDHEALALTFRIVHTLKGSAAMVGMDHLAEFAHLIEDALVLFRDGVLMIASVHVTILLQTVDVLRGMIAAASEGRMTQIRTTDRHLVLRLLPDEMRAAKLQELETMAEGQVPEAEAAGAGLNTATGPAGDARSLRVRMSRLDAALTLVGEVAVARSRLMQLLRERAATVGDEVLFGAEELDRLMSELQEEVMQLRLVPLGPTFRQHLRTVRDVAAAESKLARLRTEGEDVEVDASVVELLRDPVTHMVRNAIDHGIEFPSARRDAHKDPCGTITLRACHEHDHVVIEVEDDGAGLNRERILECARARGLVPDGELPADSQLYRIIMAPGFSTAERITELSGRGVGMDVVRRNVEALRGSVSVESRNGAGTTIRIRIPLTLAIIRGFGVRVGAEAFIVPLESVTECLDFPSSEREQARATGLLNLRGAPLPYVRLRDHFEVSGPPTPHENVVVVRDATHQAGLVVDALQGELEAVIKPLGGLFEGVPGISGSTILGDGRVGLIVDVPALIEDVLARTTGGHTASAIPALVNT